MMIYRSFICLVYRLFSLVQFGGQKLPPNPGTNPGWNPAIEK